MKFLFRLESVLILRATREKEAQENYARTAAALARAERDLSDARAELERLHEVLESSRGGRSSKNDQIIALNAIGYQQSVCDRKAERFAHAQTESQARLQDLVTAKRAREILERLRAKQQAKHRLEVERQEQIAVDDIVMAKFARKASEVTA
ncbi:MAG TPA: hypothetical protein VGI85_12275 [Chthoniobacterales bacterium]|jgi:flagellar export protein FliJ